MLSQLFRSGILSYQFRLIFVSLVVPYFVFLKYHHFWCTNMGAKCNELILEDATGLRKNVSPTYKIPKALSIVSFKVAAIICTEDIGKVA